MKPKIIHGPCQSLRSRPPSKVPVPSVRAEDSISAAENADKKEGIVAPGIIETKNIAEEGFIYGLPIVMNYAVMYEFAVDKNSGQYKAPFNQIKNEARVFTYKDTAVSRRTAIRPIPLRGSICVLSQSSSRCPQSRRNVITRSALRRNTFNYGYIGSRATGNDAGRLMVVGPDWKGETPPGVKKIFRSTTQFCSWAFEPSSSILTTCRTSRKSRRATRFSRSPFLKQPAPPAARRSTSRS